MLIAPNLINIYFYRQWLVVEGGKKSSKLAARIHIVMNDGNSILCVWQRPTLITCLMGLIKHCKGEKINAQYVKTTFY
jgi:hypothetical protein